MRGIIPLPKKQTCTSISPLHYFAPKIFIFQFFKIWQMNLWIWILQIEENYVRIQYSIKIWTLSHSFYSQRYLFSRAFAHSRFASAYRLLPFRYWYFTGQRSGFKNLNHIGNCRYFQLVEGKLCFGLKK